MRPGDAAVIAIGLAPPVVRIEARRPAAWLTFAVAAIGGLWCPGSAGPLAAAVGALLAVAAIGQLPGDARGAFRNGWSMLALVRSVWPLAGGLLAAAWLASGGGVGAAAAALGVVGSVAATAATFVACLRRDARESVVASRSLAIAGLGAASGLAVGAVGGSSSLQVAAIVAAWGLAAGSLLTSPTPGWPATFGAGRHGRALAGFGPAMASALAGMAGCYFLAPQFAWAYSLLAVGWFIVLVVPAATQRVGPAAAGRLVRSAAGRPAAPGSLAWSVLLVATTAGLLAWPAVVAAVLAGAEAWRGDGPLTALAALAAVAGLTVVVTAVASGMPGGRSAGELARAVVLSAAAAGAISVAARSARLPKAPIFPGFTLVALPRAFQTGVEACGVTCQTAQTP